MIYFNNAKTKIHKKSIDFWKEERNRKTPFIEFQPKAWGLW